MLIRQNEMTPGRGYYIRKQRVRIVGIQQQLPAINMHYLRPLTGNGKA